jgi:hypothetical protein
MERRLGSEPDPPIRSTERESPRAYRKIQGGDAAKAAEESAQSSTTYSNSFGISLRATRGAKFELEKEPSTQGEARPLSSVEATQQVIPPKPEEQQAEDASGITKKLFRRLFRP